MLTDDQIKRKPEAEALADSLAGFFAERTDRPEVCFGAMAIIISRMIRGLATDSEDAERRLTSLFEAIASTVWSVDGKRR